MLRKPFAVTLDEFDGLKHHLVKSFTTDSLARVISLAREIQVLDIIPCAFLFLSAIISADHLLYRPPHSLRFEDLVICLVAEVAFFVLCL
jgi:hypothetical protein